MNRVDSAYTPPKLEDPVNELFKAQGEHINILSNAIKENSDHVASLARSISSLSNIVENLLERLERIEND